MCSALLFVDVETQSDGQRNVLELKAVGLKTLRAHRSTN